ncbi:hypothetical protein E0L36_23505 [Streptomyces sp. AJS327]|uniref:hypothetical protein n=1 Tax=Streptomyces sp. AJS327 TaxID=2545265 RepID=UPI0015DDFDAE|nr:hypothetical protein [Streptomyces sp. AJS327]MBA0053720.1 hypothetical protein [Streptomyces sp. AJS327]
MAEGRYRLSTPAARLTTRVVLAAIGGAVAGIAAYSISQTGGQLLSVVVGGLVGVGVALGADHYRRTVRLSEVSLVLLGNTVTFTATTDMRQAAQRAFFQAATRIATRPLADGSGNLREALTSLKTLFDRYREPLESETAALPAPAGNGDSVHELMLEMLNTELGPFLATWHPQLAAWEETHPDEPEGNWPQNAAFRAELRSLQHRLRPYVVGLGTIAGLREPERHLPPLPDPEPAPARDPASAPVPGPASHPSPASDPAPAPADDRPRPSPRRPPGPRTPE